ncbi:FKBP-type peptidyl-prolyl cis-trans isomerase [Mucilaginibacter antarcticus]|uniref:Peptidyl-prolyl cis-trans isomerase n=2 Tax=Mucilaginibacter antarcticus TaxID=1855725 RepID=A0ABW5XM16_9SPHI
MNKAALIILFLACFVAGCGKSNDSGVAAYNAQKVIDDKIVADYLAANPTLKATKIDTSGVYYVTVTPGSGNDLFTRSTRVVIGYTGRLLTTGKLFAQTNDFHPEVALQTIILGWQLGIPKAKRGGVVRLLVPSRYAYGPAAQPQLGLAFDFKNGLPANAVLDFEIELFDIKN